jgi:hypothetical protein
VKALGEPSLVFKSSHWPEPERGGLHLYYLLDEHVDLYELRHDNGQEGLVLDILAAARIWEQPGFVEVLPRGHTKKFGTQNRLRLPFGKGSKLLHPDTLEALFPAAKPADELKHVRKLLETEKLHTTIGDLRARRPVVPSRRKLVARSRDRTGSPAVHLESASPLVNVERLRSIGLEQPGQRNAAVVALAKNCRRRGVPVERARPELHDWLDTRHNNYSHTYNSSPLVAHAHLDRAIDWAYAKVAPQPQSFPGLSRSECASILAAVPPAGLCYDPSTGEELRPFKVQQVCFELMRATKAWVIRETRQVLERDVGSLHMTAVVLVPKLDELFAGECATICPDPVGKQFVVAIPYALRRKVPGMKGPHADALWRAAKASGLFQLERRHNHWRHQCQMYRTTLDFGAHERHARPPTRWVDALALMLSSGEIKALYSPYYAKLARTSLTAISESQPVDSGAVVEDSIRLWLENVGQRRVAA